jgi:endonuclease/exonuclease/phosphatase family metal-dependent hydrolase
MAEDQSHTPTGGGGEAAQRLAAFAELNKRKSRRRRIAAVLFVALAAGLTWHASWRVATGPATGGRLDPPQAPTLKATFRIGTFNIHAGRGTDGRLDLARTAKSLQDIDLAGLNEVAGRWPWEAEDQAGQLGRLTGRAALFAPFERRWHCYEFGNALLSSLPIKSWERVPLPGGGDRPRNAVLARASAGSQAIQVILVHAARRDAKQRDAEIGWAVHRFLAVGEPAILLGDLNAGLEHPLLHRLGATPGVVDALAGAAGAPRERIDWILLRGLRLVRSGVRDEGASDHPLFWAEVELPQGVQ